MNRFLLRAKLDPDAWFPTQEAKRLRLTELLAQAGAMIELVWVIALVALGPFWSSVWWNVGAGIVFLLIPFLNRQKRFPLLSRLTLITFVNGWIFTLACLYGGRNSNSLCFLPMASLPFIVFDTRHRFATFYAVVLPQILFVILELSEFMRLPENLQLPVTLWTYWFTVATAFFMSVLAVLTYRRANERFEEELREVQGRFARMVQSAQEGICVCDDSGRVVYVNPALEMLLGHKPRELVGKPVRGLLSQACRERFPSLLFRERTEVELVRADKKRLTVLMSTSPLYEERGDSKATIILIMDITEAREKERFIEAQRSKMVSSAKLSALGEMAAGIAHEIFNPLTAIRLSIGLLERHFSGERDSHESARAATKYISVTTDRIVRIIEGLKAFSNDGRSIPMTDVSVARAVDDTLALCRERFRAHGVALIVLPIPPDLMVYARAVQVSQVVLNLLNNSFHAVAGKASAEVRIEAKARGSQVEVSVTDNGPGVPQDLKERIFEPFFTTKAPGEGTGLGLSVSKGIVEAHRGKLSFESRPGRTRFWFTMQRAEGRKTRAA